MSVDFYKNFQYGLISGISAIIVSHPIDTIKTNIQKNNKIKYNLKYLYNGLFPPLIGVGIEKSLVFGIYETTKPYTNSDIISGGLSGFIASFVVTPFERIKIILQTNQFSQLNMKKSFNFKFLFQGLSSTFYRETPGFAIYFSVYNYLKKNEDIGMIKSFTYGAIAGTVSWIFIYPQDLIKTYTQSNTTRNIGFIQGFNEIILSEKNKLNMIKKMYRGFSYALMRAIPLHATAFTTMELCKKYL